MEIASDFHGPVGLFPLPNVVLFPGALLPLHIFEHRYRQMVSDALDSESLIIMALLAPGWEADYYGQPAVHPVATVGRIVQHQPLPDGRSNILLEGLTRIRLEQEHAPAPYRRASIHVLHDILAPETLPQASRLAQLIHEQMLQLMFVSLDMIGATPPVPGEVMSPGRYFDKTTTALRIAPKVKQAVLNEPDILQRGRVLHHVLGQVLTAAAQGPDLPKPPEQGLPPNQN